MPMPLSILSVRTKGDSQMKALDLKTAGISMRIFADQEYDRLMDVTHEDNALSH